ncbi:amidase [Hymenobacter sp. BT683]|uniref:Amidase n=1 Tax=Hymenobacter jeongseonensis TaxID=2791027 RepID=A0ABS0INC9_9BACT|nr:amidase family protein [Hymenobacter jeongseonensis]MBF9239831.1 amidase [Hymenobacter jeongseonensis]
MLTRATSLLLALFCAFLATGCGSQSTREHHAARPPFEVTEASIAEVQQALREGSCTCEQLVLAYQARIAAYDQLTKLNAIVVLNPSAVETARQLDAEYRRTGQLRPLHCTALIVKDNFNTAGLQTAAGSRALKGFAPDTDATVVNALKAAGAIVLAKSNMAEWAFSPMVSISSLAGETRNPYNLAHVPAGSSGGTAAAVAASFGTAGLGTDTGNSIRGPSSHTALVGFRPTLGLLSRAGIAPLYLRNDTGGPMARSVADATRLLEVMATGPDPADALTTYGAGKRPTQGYQASLDPKGLQGARIGVLRTLSERSPDPQVKALFERAVADLRRAGATVVDVEIPAFDQVSADQWCSVFKHDINQYLAALGPRSPVQNIDQVLASGTYSPYIKENLQDELAHGVRPRDSQAGCGEAYTAPRRIAFRQAVTAVMDQYQVGALVYPTWNNPPARIGDFKGYQGDNSQLIAPHTGQPAFTVPMGFTYEQLPAGLQFLGRSFDEATLIKYTYAYEQATHHRQAPARFPALPAKGPVK